MEASTLTLKDAENGEGAVHTTLTREIRPIKNWWEWLARWQAVETVEEMLGLLHIGFSVSLERKLWEEKKKYDEIDRLTFYFSVADGWADHYLLELPEDGDKKYEVGFDSCGNFLCKTPSELRQELARKAFNMLCVNYFSKVELFANGRHSDEFREEWERTVTSERFFPVIQNFFRAQEARFSNRIRIRNLSRDEQRSHNEQRAVDFLINLSKFIWGWEEPEDLYYHRSNKDEERKYREYLAKMRARIDAAKPWMVGILSKIGRLDILRKWILKLDEACIKKLEEIALRNKLNDFDHFIIRNDRLAVTLDEARYVGSKAAWFLAEYELMAREHKRLSAVSEAKRQKKEAEEKIKKLTRQKQI